MTATYFKMPDCTCQKKATKVFRIRSLRRHSLDWHADQSRQLPLDSAGDSQLWSEVRTKDEHHAAGSDAKV
jgi:hypothetical protein